MAVSTVRFKGLEMMIIMKKMAGRTDIMFA